MPGLATTFELLANTENEAATAVLVAGLDASQREIRDFALTALLNRRCASAELNVLRRWPELSTRWKQQIAERPGWLTTAIRAALVNQDSRLFESACAAAVFTREYDLIPVLVTAAMQPARQRSERAATATLELCELLADEISSPRDYRVRRDPQLQRNHVLASLERAVNQHDDHGRRELLEAFLMLANRENAVLKRVLQSASDPVFRPLMEALTTSSRQNVERLLLSYLDDPHAPLTAVQAMGRRADVSFLRHLAKKIGVEPSATVRNNLRRIDSIPWIRGNLGILDALRENEQAGAVHLAAASSIARDQALQVVGYVLRHGPVAGRRVAARSLSGFPGPEADELVVQSLRDDDPLVRAAGASQLRDRGIPGAVQRLLVLLDSQHAVEQAAARAGLVEFTFERFASRFDELSPEARLSTGQLVRKVDPQAVARLAEELDAESRGRRRRGLEMAVALDAVGVLQEQIANLLTDEDQYLRIEAIRALGQVDSSLTRRALRRAMLDSQPLVEQAAEAALAALTQRDTKLLSGGGQDTVVFSPGQSPLSQPNQEPLPC